MQNLAGHGNPNGGVAGAPGQFYTDVDTGNIWVCTTDGDAATAVWGQRIGNTAGAAFSGLVTGLNPTLLANNIAGYGNPNGAVNGFAGQFYTDLSNGNIWDCFNGGNTWNLIIGNSLGAAFTGLSPGMPVMMSPPSTIGSEQWVGIQLLDLVQYLEWGYLVICNTRDLAPGQPDRFTRAAADVIMEVRQTIQSFLYGFSVSATPMTIPPELKRAACYMILSAMVTATPGMFADELGLKNRLKEWEQGAKTLQLVREGKLRPSTPPDPAAPSVQQSPAASVIRHTHRTVTAHSMRGI